MIEKMIENILPIFESKSSTKVVKKVLFSYALISILVTLSLFLYPAIKSDETNIPKTILEEKQIATQIYSEELKFREDVVNTIDTLINKYKNINNDSTIRKNIDIEIFQQFLILRNIELTNNTKQIDINIPDNIQQQENILSKVQKLHVTYSINKEKIKIIIAAQPNLSKTKELIKFGDYINKSMSVDREFQWYIVIYVLILTVSILLILLIYKNLRNKLVSSKLIKEDIKDKEKIEDKLKDISEKLNNQNLTLNQSIEEDIAILKEGLKLLELNSSAYNQLRLEVEKAENRSKDIFQRSTLMLILGLTIALIGASGFYFFLPEFKEEVTIEKYIAKSIRPTLILLFVQSIAIYLLKQYRVLIEDYKYFQKEYETRSNALSLFQILKSNDLGLDKQKLIEHLMSKQNTEQNISKDMKDNKTEIDTKDEKEVNSKFLAILEKGIDKIIK
jgi:hypothetical protein